ncbi:hypothetical protein FD723_39645 (plasmid) [Nostoc sp. C052]|uniref:hypothetical protein n=1 Tax=Nostoc sp. C052 TaxID=2576902 RepID=UPI0015C30ADA|nr:hypothetical protein [Nostoc sp. C052]QLE46326.1 hypothetical protein FD723_39645 [Nostoc sp. C052]
MVTNPLTPTSKATALPVAYTYPTDPRTANSVTTAKKPDLEYQKSTLTKQEREPWSRDYSPLQIRFLTGAYKDQLLEVGFNIKELATSQSAEWEKGKNQSIRVGHNFVSISPRTFNLTLEFWSLNEDIQQLVENTAHLHEITDNSATPPKLQFAFGSTLIDPLICTSFNFKYDTPLPNKKGMRHGTVDLVFELDAGAGTKHQLAPPLASTPLGDYKQQTTRAERQKRGIINNAKTQLAPCLSPESNAAIGSIFEENRLGDPTAIANLPSDTFINLALAGSISKEILGRIEIQEKLKNDLAERLAIKEEGVGQNKQTLKSAIISGDASSLPAEFTESQTISYESPEGKPLTKTESLFEQISGDYQSILTAIQEQKLDSSSPIFSTKNSTTAIQRVNAIGKCGISLRRLGAPKVTDVQGSNAALLAGINNAIALAKNDEEIKTIFNLASNTPETVIRKLKNSQPYKTKEDFLRDASYNNLGITGVVLWSSFSKHESGVLADVNALITKEGVTDDEIKKQFGVDDKQLVALKNGGKPFLTKEDFLKAVSKESKENPLNGGGNKIWRDFQLNKST